MKVDLSGRVAVVTGGGSGIGAATVARLREAGAEVVGLDLTAAPDILACDVTDEDAVDAAIAAIVERHGRLDLAANVAGTSGTYAEITAASTESWRRTMAVNLDGVFFCLRAELRAMLLDAAPPGRRAIVNVASSAGRMGVPGLAAYSASKHGVVGLTRSAALEVAPRGIRVNAVLPGTVRTPMLRSFVGGDEQVLEQMGARAPVGRIGEPDEIGAAIVWLLSDAASFVTGETFQVDGGVAAI